MIMVVGTVPSCSMLTRSMPCDPGRSRNKSTSSCEASWPWRLAGLANGDSNTGWMAMNGVIKWSRITSWGSSTSTTLIDARPVCGSCDVTKTKTTTKNKFKFNIIIRVFLTNANEQPTRHARACSLIIIAIDMRRSRVVLAWGVHPTYTQT